MRTVMTRGAVAVALLTLGAMACERKPDTTAALTECKTDLQETSDELRESRKLTDEAREQRHQLEVQLATLQSGIKQPDVEEERAPARRSGPRQEPPKEEVKEEVKEDPSKEPERPASPEPGSTRLRRK